MAEQGFTLTSTDFAEGEIIPTELTCEGENRPPALKWMHPTEAALSFALIADDPDAPNGTFTHWLLFDLPRDTRELPNGSGSEGVEGRNDFQQQGYGGPCPPPNHGKHRYYFKLFALDTDRLGLDAGATRDEIERAMQGHVLDTAELMGRFERTST